MTPARLSDEAINRALGEELRRARESARLTRAELVKRLPSQIQVQTLGGYERGIRQCGIPRLVEICRALKVTAPDVLALALQRAAAAADLAAAGLQVDLHAVVRDKEAERLPLRRWARNRLADEEPDGPGVVHLDPAAVREMAAIFGYSQSELVEHLASFMPASAPRR